MLGAADCGRAMSKGCSIAWTSKHGMLLQQLCNPALLTTQNTVALSVETEATVVLGC